MTLANKITIVRILLIPVFVIGLLLQAPVWPVIIFIVSALTDILDGLAARWKKEKTVLGTFLDPLADKLLLVSSYITLAHLNLLPMWAFVVVFSRDLFIFLGWSIIFILTKNSEIKPRWLGKITTFVQMITILSVLMPLLAPLYKASLILMLLLTAASTVDYILFGAKKLNTLH
ncbi:MAG TPA: CDP-alcohol phosphatidyltransferase family protein [Elusimicrobiota bacterium]|nr:CDP-alcohol phosphatidyltransferase family protein [Elusimicrobiota bacterium]